MDIVFDNIKLSLGASLLSVALLSWIFGASSDAAVSSMFGNEAQTILAVAIFAISFVSFSRSNKPPKLDNL